jgi:hypothetical protein
MSTNCHSSGNAVPNAHLGTSQQHHVSVLYGDGSHSFWLARGATLAELVLRVSGLDALLEAGPLTIDIRFEPRRLADPLTNSTTQACN